MQRWTQLHQQFKANGILKEGAGLIIRAFFILGDVWKIGAGCLDLQIYKARFRLLQHDEDGFNRADKTA